MKFSQIPLIPTTNIFRSSRVSPTRGNRVIDGLVQEGRINPTTTPAGHRLLSPHDGQIVYDALTN